MFDLKFSLEKQDKKARAGCFTTAHGTILTPVFMPVGTQATVKALSSRDLQDLSISILLCNAFHLFLRPGSPLVSRQGGLHRFMSFDGTILTDSGGFQIFSLTELNKVTEDKVLFRSPVDGQAIEMTPEGCLAMQQELGSDIAMVLDECAALPAPREKLRQATERTIRWARRAHDFHRAEKQALFGIAQGGDDLELRRWCLDELRALDFSGYALGGLSVGEGFEAMVKVLAAVADGMPADKPRYLMGVGKPRDILAAIENGIDMMDCVLPTRNARNGSVYTSRGIVRIKNARWQEAEEALDPACACRTCRTYSKAYLRHLYQAEEILALHLLTLHNVSWFLELVRGARQAILEGRFAAYKAGILAITEEDSSSAGPPGSESFSRTF